MERTVRLLKYCYCLPVAAALAAVLCFETDFFIAGALYRGESDVAEFVVTTVMELLTICVIPVSLRLFRFKKIRRALPDSPEMLLRYGSWRLALLMVPMVANTVLYYLYMVPAFGYMAVILFLASIFVYPSAARCKDETKPLNTPEK